ncbi:MAG: class II fructose-bisphosphate aldolase [Spirochaetia bacterium]|nr:class II fructose-1,6-bisphosphate aldolase [Spirochaetota bacterium]MCX8096436.1 class II fructose-1,6-bisphosphate aldolase [Spirochaetota bacterium]MDW8112760.1 class II fructose-bisphosphate aldolase [Spirochaetia bacterium]
MAIHYTELGFYNTKVMFKHAYQKGFAVPAYNFNNMEQLQAILTACVLTQSPVILQVSKGARQYANQTLLRYLGKGAVEFAKDLAASKGLGEIPIALHLDHGDSFELAKDCIDNGFSSVMIDGSHLPYEENVAITKKVVEYAHQFDVSVEGELGILAGVEEEVSAEKSIYTDPDQAADFVEKTGVDSLAISIGTSHGAYKFKVKPGQEIPPLRLDILEKIKEKIPGFPIVLHGASSVMPLYVDMINKYGGKMEDTAGVREDQIQKAVQSAVCKVNIDSDARLVMTAIIRKQLYENPGEFDPRKYLGPAREEMIKLYSYKNEKVLFSAGKAPDIMKELKG